MATLTFGMNVSLDGYVDHERFAPDAVLFRHWIEHIRGLTGSIYGSGMYALMRYWDDDNPDWSDDLREFADVWRQHPKWVVSNSLTSVGPNATLVCENLEGWARTLRTEMPGEISVSGPRIAQSFTELGLIDEYRLYYHPVVLGSGAPFFRGPRPRLHLIAQQMIGDDVIRLSYVPAGDSGQKR